MKDKIKDSYERLIHLKNAIYEIEKFTLNVNEKEFYNDSLLWSGVLFQLGVIGESVIFIDSALLNKYEYPWGKVRAFRNLISHEYFNIKLDSVWNIIVFDLPELKQVVETILENEFD